MPLIDIQTANGILRGIQSGGVKTFLGVRYGESTAGVNRFRPPVPVATWQGVREAFEFGPAAPQVDPRVDAVGNAAILERMMHPHGGTSRTGGGMSEDCLTLNIWAPSEPTDGRPVLVWLHGGGFTNGSGHESWVHGDVLAATEDVIVVTITHRLGLFGFLDLRAPEYGVAGSANAGMLDIVEALRWIQANIAGFGGDPSRVTIAGQSGGGGKVAAVTAMPAARGLFTGAILQSGPIRHFLSETDARSMRDRVTSALGTTDLEALQNVPVSDILAVMQTAMAAAGGMAGLDVQAVPALGPTLDPVDLPTNAFDPSNASDVPVIIGSTDHEVSLFFAGAPFYSAALDREEAAGLLDMVASGHGSDVLGEVAASFPTEPTHLQFARAFTAATFGAVIGAIAHDATRQGRPVWVYDFGQPTDVLGGLFGSTHALDIAYVFGTTGRIPFTGTASGREELSAEMMRAWANFARTGEPGWERWTPRTPSSRRFGREDESGRQAALVESIVRVMSAPAAEEEDGPDSTGPVGTAKVLTAKSTVGAWLKNPVGGPVIRELLAQHGVEESSLAPVKMLPLQQLVKLSQGQLPQEVIDELVRRTAALNGSSDAVEPKRRRLFSRRG